MARMTDERGADQVVDELRHWLDILAEADRLSTHMAPEVVVQIEEAGGPHEMLQMCVTLAGISSETRRSIQATLHHAVVLLRQPSRAIRRPVTVAEPPPGELRLVLEQAP